MLVGCYVISYGFAQMLIAKHRKKCRGTDINIADLLGA